MNRSAIALTRPTSARDYLGVSLFWLALSFFWGALLTIALPAHIESLFPHNKDAALSVLTASGAAVAALSQIVFGALSDGSRSRWGRRRPFLLGRDAAFDSATFGGWGKPIRLRHFSWRMRRSNCSSTWRAGRIRR